MIIIFQDWFNKLDCYRAKLLNSDVACGLICIILIKLQERDYLDRVLPEIFVTENCYDNGVRNGVLDKLG